jgi:hypothetical protein
MLPFTRQLLVDQHSHTHVSEILLLPHGIAWRQNNVSVAESIVFRAEANQAAFAASFFAFGGGATVAFRFALETPLKAAQHLICACRTRSRPSALILPRLLVF